MIYAALALFLLAAGYGVYRLVADHFGGPIGYTDWAIFKTRFIEPDGKLVDSHSKLTHSEGQGYAMLLALAAGDRPVFDRVWNWTRTNLRRDDDALLAWKWKPDGQGGGAVDDTNDAADADILIAWALHRAAKQWHEPAYDAAAAPIARDVLDKLVRDVGGVTILMPGRVCFEQADGITINLSYWIFPAFAALNELAPSPRWQQLEQSGLDLIAAARFGRQQLPSDWLLLRPRPGGGVTIALTQDQPLFGYDAVRIPLYLLWGGKASPAAMAPFLAYWQAAPADIPATVNLVTGDAAPYPISPGVRAIVSAVESRDAATPGRSGTAPALPSLDPDQDYYSAALGLLVRLALRETS